MVGSPLLRAGVAAFSFAVGVLPASARELEFPLCEPARAERTSAPAEGRFSVRRPFDLLGDVAEGLADVARGMPTHAPAQFRRSLVVELPGAIPEGMAGHDLLWNAHDAGLLDAEFSDNHPLAFWTAPPNILVLRNVEVRAPGDLEGLRIRDVGEDAAAIIKAFGAVAVYLPAGEIHGSLDTGLIDGVVGAPSMVRDLDLDEVANGFTVGVPLGQASYHLVVDRGTYDALGDVRKDAIGGIAGRGLSQDLSDVSSARGAEIVERLKARGDNAVYSLTEEQRAAFAAVAQPVTEALVAEHGLSDTFAVMRAE